MSSQPSLIPRPSCASGVFFSRDLAYIIAHEQDRLKDCCTFLPFAGESVSALSLWYMYKTASEE